jgi:hypothetical protein
MNTSIRPGLSSALVKIYLDSISSQPEIIEELRRRSDARDEQTIPRPVASSREECIRKKNDLILSYYISSKCPLNF